MTYDLYQTVLDRRGARQQTLEDRERWALMQGWRRIYAARLYAATGRWKHGPFEWHIFSHGYAHALHGERAALAYEAERSDALIVCPESGQLPAVCLTAGVLPDFRPECDDVYVWPDDFSWTMAFTHEESWGLGPYFCRREWVVEDAGHPAGPRRREKYG